MLRALELQNIRSYKNGLFEFAEGVNIIVGPNASGKTNLLEAIYMVCRGSGFRGSDANIIMNDQSWGRIDASIGDGSRAVKIVSEPASKTFIIDDVERKRLSDNTLRSVVLFEPGHMLLLAGEPERRRTYVDDILIQVEPGFRSVLRSYKRALAQRNRLLKQEVLNPEHMFVWDLRVGELAGELVDYRVKYIDRINKNLSADYRSISGGQEELDIFYDSKLPLDGYTEALLKKLKDSFELDRLRGYTGAGPHRDDIGVTLNGHEARSSASRGETRSIILALKIAELKIVKEKSHKSPLLLLDDVFSELDGKRRRLLAEALKDTQAFITTTDADAIIKSFMSDYNVITTRVSG